jgi:hypothetical protein
MRLDPVLHFFIVDAGNRDAGLDFDRDQAVAARNRERPGPGRDFELRKPVGGKGQPLDVLEAQGREGRQN